MINPNSYRIPLVVYNGNRQAQSLTVPGNWIIVANDKKAGIEAIESKNNKIQLETCSLVIAVLKGGPGQISQANKSNPALSYGVFEGSILSRNKAGVGAQSLFPAYFTRKVNRVVSFNGSPGLTTMDGKFL